MKALGVWPLSAEATRAQRHRRAAGQLRDPNVASISMTLVLVDTSVWIDHLHRGDDELVSLLESNLVVVHPMVVGELSLGNIRDRTTFLGLLARLPPTPVATTDEILSFVDSRRLFGRGLSLVDAYLLASALIAGDVKIYTRDRRLADAAAEAGVRWSR